MTLGPAEFSTSSPLRPDALSRIASATERMRGPRASRRFLRVALEHLGV
jgi:hypothetical protein